MYSTAVIPCGVRAVASFATPLRPQLAASMMRKKNKRTTAGEEVSLSLGVGTNMGESDLSFRKEGGFTVHLLDTLPFHYNTDPAK
jgi:hypothetical protein